jgi:WXG100 family type VII secretion target
MAMRGYRTTPAILNQAGADSDAVAADIDTQLQALRAYVESLIGQWRGIAPGTFQGLMERYQADSTKLNTALRGIATTLRFTANQYAQGEDASNSALAGVMPGGTVPLAVNM